jgi:hypothetical protein
MTETAVATSLWTFIGGWLVWRRSQGAVIAVRVAGVFMRQGKKPNTHKMKAIKVLIITLCAAVVCCGNVLAGDKHECCEKAKKEGKTCEKCVPKDEKKK